MSYQVLARKWRPATFEQMVGQSHVLHALTNALTQQRLHHAYLFTGTRGVGKTSLARLFAKGLNCEQGVTATPCGQCSACVEIAEGRFVDLIEVDAASRTKVDDTRELLDNVQYRPSRGRFKVYLIDEVHMLSRSSFNALLKTLEEPPEHVKFLLATTDPQRLPVTVLSRCLQFNLKSLSQDEIAGQLGHVLTQEQLSFDHSALTLLAKAANGSMRDALSLTDQAIAFGAGQVKLEQVQTMLGSIDEQHVIALLEALAQADIMNLMQVTAKVLSFGAEPEEVLRSLLELLHQITLTQFAPAAAQMSLYSEQIKAFAEQLSAEQIQLYYQLLLTGRKDLPHAPDPKSGLEMALLRAVTFVPEKPVTRWASDNKVELQIPDATSQARSSTQTHSAVSQQTAQSLQQASLEAQKKTADSVASTVNNDTQLTQAAVESKPKPVVTPEAESKPAPVVVPEVESKPEPVVKPETESAVLADNINPEGETISESAKPVQQLADADQDDTVESESLASLNSEMAVIMSQAQSQGFEQTPEPSVTRVDAEASQSSEPVLDKTAGDANAIAQPATDGDSQSKVDETSVHFTQSYGSEENDLASYADYAGAFGDQHDYQDDYGFTQQDVNYEVEQTHVTFDAEPSKSHARATHDDTAAQPSEPQPSTRSDFTAGDDILDAVLAARATLLEELTEDNSKDGQTKKSVEVRKPFTPPVRKEPTTVQAEHSDESHVDDAQSDVNSLASAEVNTSTEVIDRPPWEEPHDDDPCARFGDDVSANDTDNAEAESSVEQAPQPIDASSEQQGLVEPNNSHSQSLEQQTGDSTQVQDPELNLPALPSGELSGHEVDLKWYRFMSELEVGGRVRQLAVNSVCHQFEQPLSLLLKPDQKHLAADVAIKQLEEAMTAALGEQCSVQVTVGADHDRETPLEVRRRFHKEILTQVHHELMTDDNVRWLTQNMGAELTADSLTYAPELLVQKGNRIELIDIANFKRLTES
ncbi:DNA polymerase III subunit gamma/tau [Shewanella fidelis]|uniref:DNA polymerase III subunit gamma/tau n=1 Tax=Shewanella fidelis TaxID=173509 RepID=UPI000490818E|nr:DNA polymerase III subunit gamma/tau [Shewanella fidelis]